MTTPETHLPSSDTLDLEQLLTQLGAEEERVRFSALMLVRTLPGPLPPELVEGLKVRLDDPARTVRALARELYDRHVPNPAEGERPLRELRVREVSPSSTLLALISFGSASSGMIATGICLLHFYVLGSFPFPNPLDVLVVLNAGLTLPYLAIGGLLLLPGTWPKELARRYALFSLLASVALIFGLRPTFLAFWANQFTEEARGQFASLFSPGQVALALMPVLAGQAMQLFYSRQLLAETEREKLRSRTAAPGNGSQSPDSASGEGSSVVREVPPPAEAAGTPTDSPPSSEHSPEA